MSYVLKQKDSSETEEIQKKQNMWKGKNEVKNFQHQLNIIDPTLK